MSDATVIACRDEAEAFDAFIDEDTYTTNGGQRRSYPLKTELTDIRSEMRGMKVAIAQLDAVLLAIYKALQASGINAADPARRKRKPATRVD